jgi:hypothetical protein
VQATLNMGDLDVVQPNGCSLGLAIPRDRAGAMGRWAPATVRARMVATLGAADVTS